MYRYKYINYKMTESTEKKIGDYLKDTPFNRTEIMPGQPESRRSPREIELSEKKHKGTITPEEEGELYGLRVFPDNLRGQELEKRKYLGIITKEEEEELIRLRQLQRREKTMSPELQKLWERVEANDPNVVLVDMNQENLVEVSPDDEDEKVIFTRGLRGCFGILVFCEDEGGRKTAILAHYDPSSIYLNNIDKLITLIKFNPAMKTSKYKQLILLGLAAYEQNPKTKQWESKISDQQKADLIITRIQTELGSDVKVKLEPYSLLQVEDIKDQGSLIVRIPSKRQASYRTWFSQGQLGEIDENHA